MALAAGLEGRIYMDGTYIQHATTHNTRKNRWRLLTMPLLAGGVHSTPRLSVYWNIRVSWNSIRMRFLTRRVNELIAGGNAYGCCVRFVIRSGGQVQSTDAIVSNLTGSRRNKRVSVCRTERADIGTRC